jgi:hypothetical protein
MRQVCNSKRPQKFPLVICTLGLENNCKVKHVGTIANLIELQAIWGSEILRNL